MRVKIGDTWYENDQVIMLELTTLDKENIRNMHPDATKYACFPKDCTWTGEQKLDWMQDG